MSKKKKSSASNDPQAAGTARLGQFGSAISQICEEKGISKEKVIEAIESALAAAYKKDYGRKGQHIRAAFDEVTGNADFFLVKEVVDEHTREFSSPENDGLEESAKEVPDKEEEERERIPRFNPERDIMLDEVKKIKPEAVVGDIVEEKLDQKGEYGRVAAQTAKQVIIQKIREAERDAMYDEYKKKEGEVLSGIIQRVEGRNVFIDLGKSTGVLFSSEQVEGKNIGLAKESRFIS